jgi:glyoxylase-like metal-dependent hydrolase (beta-lactamase superfamily II)
MASQESTSSSLLTNPGWTVQYQLKSTLGWTIAGRSRSKESTGFYIIEPAIFLDAGLACRQWKASTILITHTHFDHAGELPVLLRGFKYCLPS